MKSPIWLVGGVSGFIASLSCLIPVLVLVLGLATLSSAIALGDFLFYKYWWAFVGAGLISASVITYFYARKKKGVCTRSDILTAILIFLAAYLVFELFWEIFWVRLGFYQ